MNCPATASSAMTLHWSL